MSDLQVVDIIQNWRFYSPEDYGRAVAAVMERIRYCKERGIELYADLMLRYTLVFR